MYRLSLEEALRQRLKTVEQLERVRAIYLRKIEKATRQELENWYIFFSGKEAELMIHETLLTEARPTFPKFITPELMANKTRMIMLWRGLKEEVERRL